ncbi:hypothetical protein [Streptomyces sp. NPDC102360]|uniref:hypothetical protein n=1 Tax=Streptomyces sp. NPDC102360 TaxID=3366160 RepID=UPI00382D2B92
MVATDSVVPRASIYDHQALVDVLAGLMASCRPSVIHTMDPDPDYQVYDAAYPQNNDQPHFSDHRDHAPTALFTWKAISQWVADSMREGGHTPGFVRSARHPGCPLAGDRPRQRTFVMRACRSAFGMSRFVVGLEPGLRRWAL